jgi:hypothetical protein
VYKSAIAYGTVQVAAGSDTDQNAYERPGYPMIDRIILYEVSLEIVTGKLNVGLHH